MVSYLKDTNAIEYYSGSAWVAVGGGGGGGGKVLQVVQGTTTTATYSSTTSLADTTLTASITPSASTSKVLVLVAQNGVQKSASNSGNGVILKLLRGASSIADFGAGSLYNAAAERLDSMSFSINYLDSPATTSSTTYKTQFANRVSAAQVAVQDGNELSTIILMEIGA
jgi:3-deoxy-D-arabino-heptulosonate 7-phosphate (DAHP) synthase